MSDKPRIEDYPPRNPHDMEWTGCDPQYLIDLAKWEEENTNEEKDWKSLYRPINEMFDKSYNEGVDACIEELREEFLETFGYADDEHGLFDDLKKRFEQLKKPLQ